MQLEFDSSANLKQLQGFYLRRDKPYFRYYLSTLVNLQTLNQQGLLARHRYLVFSAHGYLSIVLGQVNNPASIDGYITAGEWTGYNLKSDLMVLSACQTGLGEAASSIPAGGWLSVK